MVGCGGGKKKKNDYFGGVGMKSEGILRLLGILEMMRG